MKNLKKKFGKFAISTKEANSVTGGQDYVWCCNPTSSPGTCSADFATAYQQCGCPPRQFCADINLYQIFR